MVLWRRPPIGQVGLRRRRLTAMVSDTSIVIDGHERKHIRIRRHKALEVSANVAQ